MGVFAGGALLGGVERLGSAVSGFLGDAITESRDAAKGLAQTEAAIKSTGGAANVTADEIVNLAGSLSKTTLYSDDSVQGLENLILTFTNVKNAAGEGNDIFTQTTKIALDMAAALGTDASGSAIQLGKALNDPTKGMAALTRAGVTFTKQQTEQIKTLQASGDLLGAQKIILAELTHEFGGSAEAAAKADGGFHLFQQRLADTEQTIGDALQPALQSLMTYMAGPGMDAIEGLAKSLSGPLTAAVDWLVHTGLPGAIEGFQGIWGSVKTLVTGDFSGGIFGLDEDSGFVKFLLKVHEVGATTLGEISKGFGIARDAVLTFVQAFSGNWVDASGILPFHQAVGEVGLALGEFSRWIVKIGGQLSSGDWSGAFTTLTSGLSGFASTIGTTISNALPGIISTITTWIGNQAGPILTQLETWGAQFIAWIPDAMTKLLNNLPMIYNTVFKWIGDQAAPILTQLGLWAQQFIAWIGPQIPGFLEAVGAFGIAIGTAIGTAVPVIVEKTKLWANALVDWVQNTAIPALTPAFNAFSASLTGEMGRVQTALVDGGAKAGKATVDALAVGWAAAPAAVTTMMNGLASAININSPVFWKAVQLMAEQSAKLLVTELETAIPLVVKWGGEVAQAITNIGPLTLAAAAKVGYDASWGIYNAGSAALKEFQQPLINLGISIVGFVDQGLRTATNLIGEAARAIGQGILDGILGPLKSLAGTIASTISGALAGALATVRSSQKIHSPSQLWADEIGAPIVAGITYGMLNEWPNLLKAMRGSLNATIQEIVSFVDGGPGETLNQAGADAINAFIGGMKTASGLTSIQSGSGGVADAIRKLLQTGDFAGGIFGKNEDDPFIAFLLKARTDATALQNILDVLKTGDFKGGILGLQEDDPFILALLKAHDAAEKLAGSVKTDLAPTMRQMPKWVGYVKDFGDEFHTLDQQAQDLGDGLRLLGDQWTAVGSGMSIAGPAIDSLTGQLTSVGDAATAAAASTSKATDDILSHIKMMGGKSLDMGFSGDSGGMPGFTGGSTGMPGYGAGQGAGMGFGDGWQQGIEQIGPVIQDSTRQTFFDLQNNVLIPWQDDTRTFFSGAGFGFIGAASEGMNSAGGGLALSAAQVGGAAGSAFASSIQSSAGAAVTAIGTVAAALAALQDKTVTITVNTVHTSDGRTDNSLNDAMRGVGLS